MSYTPDPTQVTEPTDSQKASTMGAELRAIKAYIQSTLLALINAKVSPNGAGAVGTWGINITGNAATATTAGSATTAGTAGIVTGQSNSSVGTLKAQINGWGWARICGGSEINSGYVEFWRTDNIRTGYIGYSSSANNVLNFHNDLGAGWSFNTPIQAPSFVGSLAWGYVVGRPTHLSHFINDIGAGGGGSPAGVSSWNGRTGAVMSSQADIVNALGYTPYSAGNPSGFLTSAGVASAGYAHTGGPVTFAGLIRGNGGGSGLGAIHVSTSGPSGGVDGDIWLQVAA